KKHGSKSLRKQDCKDALKFIGEIRAMIEGKLTNATRKHRNEMMNIRLDKTSPASSLQIKQNYSEFNVLAAHEVMGSIDNALDKVENHWQKLLDKLNKD
ncbi:hypothetical protein DSS60_23630, partial [Salmonella enterica subsp. enterica serovar Amager]|nr:hypothetical protein [Salmonella enterica subsp. enterica serovar Amager]